MKSMTFETIAFALLMSLIMSGSMSLFMIFIDDSPSIASFGKWPEKWVIAFVIAFPTSLIANRLIDKLFQFFKQKRETVKPDSYV